MAVINGKNYTKEELLRYAGNFSHIAGITPVEYAEGRGRGTRGLELRTGGGLEVEFLPDRCLDISALRFYGITLSQRAKNGLTAPADGLPIPGEFGRAITGGMMFTAGLLNAGPDCTDTDGLYHSTHGSIGFTPAEQLSYGGHWEGDDYVFEISGTMREARLFGQNLVLRRKIRSVMGGSEIEITDELENLAPEPCEFCILYHCNFGFPFLCENLDLSFPENKITPRTPEAEAGLAEADRMTAPQDGFFEHVFFRSMKADNSGWVTVSAENKELDIGASISYEQKNLPVFVQWKSMRSGDYALGLEPANNYLHGRKEERENETLQTIDGFKKKIFRLKISAYAL